MICAHSQAPLTLDPGVTSQNAHFLTSVDVGKFLRANWDQLAASRVPCFNLRQTQRVSVLSVGYLFGGGWWGGGGGGAVDQTI